MAVIFTVRFNTKEDIFMRKSLISVLLVFFGNSASALEPQQSLGFMYRGLSVELVNLQREIPKQLDSQPLRSFCFVLGRVQLRIQDFEPAVRDYFRAKPGNALVQLNQIRTVFSRLGQTCGVPLSPAFGTVDSFSGYRDSSELQNDIRQIEMHLQNIGASRDW